MPERFSLQPEILEYYAHGQEAARLERPSSIWEKVRTLDLLKRFLPPAPAVVLDVGGGAGAYAFALAENGYIVDLIDPVPLHIDQAKKLAVLFLGSLYHLTDSRERLMRFVKHTASCAPEPSSWQSQSRVLPLRLMASGVD